ncbi:hypothetical protein THAOC_11871 [Thalassiosira oceanica]|uniref:Isochorismatase-like domain-containing protein n=1 Tax=Thalassiosira oceanica TaxID=159749 RepID=K0T9D6_THAOC|nr:hypothetical protein THAOC_11871 [Thalassiosira oceanica]|eukprot:EJK67137.1 hypothetical protein THAOC_11871 [Thalassiosira oceanica]
MEREDSSGSLPSFVSETEIEPSDVQPAAASGENNVDKGRRKTSSSSKRTPSITKRIESFSSFKSLSSSFSSKLDDERNAGEAGQAERVESTTAPESVASGETQGNAGGQHTLNGSDKSGSKAYLASMNARLGIREPRQRSSLGEDLPSIRSIIRAGVTNRDEIKLRPISSALLVIDIQKELSTVDINSPHIEYAKIAFPRMIENTSKLLAAMRTNRSRLEPKQIGSEVIFTYIEALTDDSRDVSLDYKLSGAFLANLPGPSNPAQFVQGVEPIPGKDIRMPKTSCSVFMSTNIDYVLRNLNVEQLIICGQLTDQCVESACRDAADRGYLVTVAKDACAAQCTKDHLKGMKGMKGFSRQLTTDEILKELTT